VQQPLFSSPDKSKLERFVSPARKDQSTSPRSASAPPDGARVSFRFNHVAGDQDLAWHPGHYELPNESEEGGLIAYGPRQSSFIETYPPSFEKLLALSLIAFIAPA
jgi:hypothetical protein